MDIQDIHNQQPEGDQNMNQPHMISGWVNDGHQMLWQSQPMPPLAPHQVLIHVQAAGVNRADLLQRQGKYPPPLGASPVLGLEASGTVVAVGDKVTTLHKGDRVMALMEGGAYATHVIAHEGLCLPMPDTLGWIEGATLMEAAFTWQNLGAANLPAAYKTLLIHGAAGGVGSLFIQFAKALGLITFVTVSSPDKAKLCLSLGADQFINYKQDDFESALLALTEGNGVDVIIDCVGGEQVAQNLQCLVSGGRLIQLGTLGGAKATVPLLTLMRKGLILTGATLRDKSLEHKLDLAQKVKAWLIPLWETGHLTCVIHQVFPMAQAPQALDLMAGGQYGGKLVLRGEG